MQKCQQSFGKTLAVLALTIGFFVAAGGHVHAATQNITLSPTSVDQTLQPGSVNKGTVEVLNTGDGEFSFSTYLKPFRVTGEDYQQEFTALPGAPEPTKWFQISASQSTIKPGKLVEISYTITVPKNTPAGGYYAVLFAETKAPPATNGVIVTNRVGEIFYITVAGPLTQQGKVASWESSLLQKPPLNSSLRIENSGNTHFLSTVQLSVKDIFGGTKFSFNTKKEVLPQTVRHIQIPWQKTPSFGLFKVSGSVSFLDKKETLASKYVLVMSQTARLIFAGLVVLVIGVLVFLMYRKKSKKHGSRYKA